MVEKWNEKRGDQKCESSLSQQDLIVSSVFYEEQVEGCKNKGKEGRKTAIYKLFDSTKQKHWVMFTTINQAKKVGSLYIFNGLIEFYQ